MDSTLRELDVAYEKRAKALFAQMHDTLAGDGRQFDDVLLTGDAAEQLQGFVATSQADLVVLATHGYGFMRRMVLGSVASAMVHAAPCSVLCVPGSARTSAAVRARSVAQSTTRRLPGESLDAELAAFASRNAGRECAVEVDQPDFGAQQIGHGLRVNGATYDSRDATVSLMFGEPGLGPHLTHTVATVSGIDLSTDANGRDLVLRVVHGGGHTLLQLE
jgi:hypothetical protein